MRLSSLALAGVLGAFLLGRAAGQGTVELRQDGTRYNVSSTNGLPISTTPGVPDGSNGRGPKLEDQQANGLTEEPATTNQFQAAVSFGGVVQPTNTAGLNPNVSYALNAESLGLPRGPQSGLVKLILTRGRAGAPFSQERVSLLFGQVVPLPDIDELGALLSLSNTNLEPDRLPQRPEDYWQAEPYTTTGHTNSDYYYSPHARQVFATKAGPMQVVWQRRVTSSVAATDGAATVTNQFGVRYVVKTINYLVSASPVKPQRLMYWTEKTFLDTGKPILVPTARIGDINIVYNNNFSNRVDQEVFLPGVQPIVEDPTQMLQETRTLWYDQQARRIRAYNLEGRVFLELLGDVRPDGNREHLGYEIVDVLRRPSPADLTIELGERLPAYAGGIPSDEALLPEALLQPNGQEFAYRHPGGDGQVDYYATRETVNQSDLQVHWMEAGEQGLRWPFRFVRYKLEWPADVAKYSHYVRPRVDTEGEAKATAVPLPTENGPFIAYQDPLDQPRGKLTENFAYYSWLTPQYPAHRALLRFTAGSQIRFERVFSWLDEGLRDLRYGFASDFTKASAGAKTFGGATVADGVLQLTGGGNTGASSYVLDGFEGEEPVKSFRAAFRLRLQGSPASGGVSFNFVGDDDLTVEFQREPLGSRPAGITLLSNGVPVPGGFRAHALTNTNFVPVEIVLREGGAVTVTYDGVTVLTNVLTGYTPRTGRFGFTSTPPVVRRAWQIADGTNSAGLLFYTNSLTAAQKTAATNAGWRFTVVNRLVAGSGGVGSAQNMIYGNGVRRFSVAFDTNSSGQLLAVLAGFPTTTNVLASGTSATNYHRHELIYDPGTANGTYWFDGAPIRTWSGQAQVAQNGQALWGANASAGLGTMNYHQVQFAINGLGTVSEYNAGLGYSPEPAANPTNQGWALTRSPANPAVTFSSVSPDLTTPHVSQIEDLSILVNRTNNPASLAFGTSVATNLGSWSANGFQWPAVDVRPRVTRTEVEVGQRLSAPVGELGAANWGTNYLAGYLRQSEGTSFHPGAYIDPFAAGFEAANQGAIIPVNAIPGDDQLEVWWFRRNGMPASQVFRDIFWPSVVSRYTMRWPGAPAEIVLASNEGSGALASLQANGSIYFENDRNKPGYNPNEEHALMQGGQAWALRDDLNITTNTNGEYSSRPFVLLSYTDSDRRPSMEPFQVLREKPGIEFDYTRQAGLVLQAPMPLPLLEKPLAPNVPGQPPNSLNTEILDYRVETSTAQAGSNTMVQTTGRHFIKLFQPVAMQDAASPGAPAWMLPTTVSSNTLIGPVTSLQPMALGVYSATPPANNQQWRYTTQPAAGLIVSNTAIVFRPQGGTFEQWPVTIVAIDAASRLITVSFGVAVPESAKSATLLVAQVQPYANNIFAGQRLAPEPLPTVAQIPDATKRARYGAFTFKDRKGSTWIYRGPHHSEDRPVLVMQFYYKTLPGFFYPSLALNAQPPVGTITPYLTPTHPDGSPATETTYGNADNNQVADGNALGITYRPVWPADAPVLEMAETLTTPRRGLPAMRGQSSLEIFYQQSWATNGEAAPTAVLHDPTREKEYALGPKGNTAKLDELPPSVKTYLYQGKVYFPNLPPHLVERFFYDPNRGTNGHLVFKGQFVDAALGDAYVLLNTLSASDATALQALCDPVDQPKAKWDAAIAGLATTLETFIEDPAKPRTYKPDRPRNQLIGSGALAQIIDDDTAVDSYALTATGPGVGFVSVLAGNGRAFTPEGDPVSVKILRVADTLYRGEVNIVESSNPLNEKLVLQQVVDLAARAEEYRFEWKIAAPVDGLPPQVYTQTPVTLLADANWDHLRFPLATDTASTAPGAETNRIFAADDGPFVRPVSDIAYTAVALENDQFVFQAAGHGLLPGNRVVLHQADGTEVTGTVHGLTTTTNLHVTVDPNQPVTPQVPQITGLYERVLEGQPQSIVFQTFDTTQRYPDYWLSLELDEAVGAVVYLDGQVAARVNTGLNDTPTASAPPTLNPLTKVFRLSPALLSGGTRSGLNTTHTLAVELFSGARPGALVACHARLEAFESKDDTVQQWLPLETVRYPDGVRAILGGAGDVQSLGDNYVIMRYQARNTNHASYVSNGQGTNLAWSEWTAPQLAEGWIKRVLRGINPFNQRVTDLFNNAVNTDVSIVSQAGQRWEGDVALNLEALASAGLIEIYETVLGRGKDLSINAGINYGPANDALLLAAGYLNDLYMMLGNEASADAVNPTIGFGTKDSTYGDIATALFSFKGQLPTLLEEELALLRGRDDFLLPGVELRPVYNRLIWNYTRGIDAGEVVYALNYNILDQNNDGKSDADDARRLYPQGHGDAYGHYLTALKGYYKLLLNPKYDWVPRSEAVTVLGKPVSVDYQDERKFAAAAAAVARTGRQVFDLTWRRDYQSGTGHGWSHFAASRQNTAPPGRVREWGLDQWATRTGCGAYVHWVVGNALLPDHDPDPSHQGSIQQIDRTTVPELKELALGQRGLQTALDNAEAGLTPMGLPEGTIPFDLNPLSIASESLTHFEQIYQRATDALNNAVVSFDDAKDVTRLMRSEEDSLADFRATVAQQELAYTNALIELYGTPYPDDVGPGRTYRTGYNGPDTLHYMYVDNQELTFTGPQGTLLDPAADVTWRIDTQTFQPGWADDDLLSTFGWINPARIGAVDGQADPLEAYADNTKLYVEYNLSSHGFFKKPTTWTGQRASPGRIQQAISDIIKARNAAYEAFYEADAAKYDLDWAIRSLQEKKDSNHYIRERQERILGLEEAVEKARLAYEITDHIVEFGLTTAKTLLEIGAEEASLFWILGDAEGTDAEEHLAIAIGKTLKLTLDALVEAVRFPAFTAQLALESASSSANRWLEFNEIAPEEFNQELRDAVSDVRDKVYGMNNNFMTINARLQELDDAQRAYRTALADGDRIQMERQIFRQRTAAVIQGYRTRDAAFRIFRNEKLERYKSLYDLAAKYTFMAAQAYDYDTGLLYTDQGREFINRIIRSRALGVVRDGVPQFAGSNTGDPGLSSVLAEMNGDWSVIKSRLGFNNPDAYGTTVSLRTENFRILPTGYTTSNNIAVHDADWKDVLNAARKKNLLDDPDVRRYCMQIDPGNGLPVPGLMLEFSTTIADGLNFFGQPLAPWDHTFDTSSFATKIYAVGVALEGYQGMDDPDTNDGAVNGAGGDSPDGPDLAFLDPNAMAATPYVYLIPVGVDSMRSPPLGDQSVIRTWSVQDVTIPLPFNIGGSDFSSKQLWQSADSLTEPLFNLRKHQAFRPVSTASVFGSGAINSAEDALQSRYTSTRLIGRSVWNSKWKLVIPGDMLLNNPDEGLERFIRTVHDIKLYFMTYSYSGN